VLHVCAAAGFVRWPSSGARFSKLLKKILGKLTMNLRKSYETLRKVSKINLRKS